MVCEKFEVGRCCLVSLRASKPGSVTVKSFKTRLRSWSVTKKLQTPYTILLNNYYMEVIPLFVGENILQTKTIYFRARHGKSSFIARQDTAELSAGILTTPGHEQNKQ
ncbi:hypothetical protein SAMN05518672_101338 [Chitinophaga sp. CF118]|nr:hypothetical protein SAMN05518672_101338 [Chitinophaga sp. CF118]